VYTESGENAHWSCVIDWVQLTFKCKSVSGPSSGERTPRVECSFLGCEVRLLTFCGLGALYFGLQEFCIHVFLSSHPIIFSRAVGAGFVLAQITSESE